MLFAPVLGPAFRFAALRFALCALLSALRFSAFRFAGAWD